MTLQEKKQSLDEGKMREKPEKMPPPPPPPPKDTSGFGGKPYISQEKGREWMRGEAAYKTTGLPGKKRTKFWEETFKDTGYYLEKGEPEKKLKYLEMKRFRATTDAERKEINEKIKLIKGFLGKK
jgi:hypothetical protein